MSKELKERVEQLEGAVSELGNRQNALGGASTGAEDPSKVARIETLEKQVADQQEEINSLSDRIGALEDDSEPTEDDEDESDSEPPEPLEKGDEET
jgi:DNA-binding ferritin-like protein